eukprot:1190646-Prorocentrum_minimum.AAC.1
MAPNHHAKGGAPRGSTSSMKDILYGGSPEPAYGRGNQHSHAASSVHRRRKRSTCEKGTEQLWCLSVRSDSFATTYLSCRTLPNASSPARRIHTVGNVRRERALWKSQNTFADDVLGISPHRPQAQAQRGCPSKKAGDKGNKFSIGAEKVGAGHNFDAAQEAYAQSHEAAMANRRGRVGSNQEETKGGQSTALTEPVVQNNCGTKRVLSNYLLD